MNLEVFREKKRAKKKISMMTCYDYTSARLLRDTQIDAVLVGDSVAMTIYGHKSTLPATVEMIARHTEAVRRGLGDQVPLIADLPFLEHRGSIDRCLDGVKQLMVAGADAIKIEAVRGHEDVLSHLVQSGIPVMGHLGLTPQFIHTLGGYRVQGRDDNEAHLIFEDAQRLEQLGVFAIVLECVPHLLASQISAKVSIPTIGIGAGREVDGQILVIQDALGLNIDFQPKFVRRFTESHSTWITAINQYCEAVETSQFPSESETY